MTPATSRNTAHPRVWPASLLCLGLTCLSCASDGGQGPTDAGDLSLPSCDGDVVVVGGSGADECWGAAFAGPGDALVACFVTAPGAAQTDGLIRRIAADGQTLWERTTDATGSEQLFMVAESAGRVWVGGLRWEPGDGLFDPTALLLRFEVDGTPIDETLVWATPGWDEVDGIHVQAGSVWLSGFAQGPDGTQDVRVERRDDDLAPVWSTTWDFAGGNDAANGHLVVLDGNAFVAATVNASNLFFLDGDAALLAFSAESGDFGWSRTWGTATTRENGLGLATNGQALFLVGEGNPSGGAGNVLLGAWSPAGDLLWQVEWGGAGVDRARAVAVDPSGGTIVVAANTDSYGAGGTDVALLAFDPADGALVGEALWGGSGDDTAHDLAVRDGRILVSGDTGSGGALDGFVMTACGPPFRVPGGQ